MLNFNIFTCWWSCFIQFVRIIPNIGIFKLILFSLIGSLYLLIPQFLTFMDSGLEQGSSKRRRPRFGPWSHHGLKPHVVWVLRTGWCPWIPGLVYCHDTIIYWIEVYSNEHFDFFFFFLLCSIFMWRQYPLNYKLYNLSTSGWTYKPEMNYFTCISSPTGLNACISSLKYHWFFVIAQPIGVKNVLLIQQYNGLNSSLDQSNSLTSFSNRSKVKCLGWISRNFKIFIFQPKLSFLRENHKMIIIVNSWINKPS